MTDLKLALRQLVKSPGFTAVVVLSLAIGIGANTAIFSLIDAVLLRSLPVQKPKELVLVRWLDDSPSLLRGIMGQITKDPTTGLKTNTASPYLAFERLEKNPPEALSNVFAFGSLIFLHVKIDGQATMTNGQAVSGGYFQSLGMRALRGRLLNAEDDRSNAAPVAVISYRMWQRHFGGADTAIGKVIRVNDVAVTIVGVTPRDFNGTLQFDELPMLTVPITLEPQLRPKLAFLKRPAMWWVHIMGRLRPDFTAEQAQAQLEPIFVQAAHDAFRADKTAGPLPAEFKQSTGLHVRLESGAQGLMENRRSYLFSFRILMGIVGLVLLIACANIAGLLLVRAAVRRKEIAVRLSLGASRAHVIRQLFVESLLLALLGGALGLAFAFWGHDALQHLRPIRGEPSFALNLPVLAFTMTASLGTSVLFGLAPAWLATRLELTSALKQNTGGSAGAASFVLRRSLIVAQTSLSVVLLVGAGLLLHTLYNLRTVDTGFSHKNLLYFRIDVSDKYRGPQISALFDRLTQRFSALPGVRSVALSSGPLLNGGQSTGNIVLDNPRLPATTQQRTGVNVVSPNFFSTLGIPVLLGRTLNENDTADRPQVAVVNETFARTFFPDENPLGKNFGIPASPALLRPARQVEIVGVVRDTRSVDLRNAIPPTAYFSFYQDVWNYAVFIARTTNDPQALVPSLRTTVQAVDPNLTLLGLKTQDDLVAELLGEERLFATLSAFFAAIAVGLTIIGLYGLLMHQVALRTREIGIRLALGAPLHAIRRLVLSEGLCLVIIGIVLGIAVSCALVRFVARLLFQVPPSDLFTFAAVGFLLVAAALLACWLPARRASRVNPMVALRAE